MEAIMMKPMKPILICVGAKTISIRCVRALMAVVSISAWLLFAVNSYAQDQYTTLPSVIFPPSVDENGVDITKGSFHVSHSLSIGPETGGFKYNLSYSSAMGNNRTAWRDNIDGIAYCINDIKESANKFSSYSLATYKIAEFDGGAELIGNGPDQLYAPQKSEGQVSDMPWSDLAIMSSESGRFTNYTGEPPSHYPDMINHFTYQTKNGTEVQYWLGIDYDNGCFNGNNIKQVKKPDGEVLSYISTLSTRGYKPFQGAVPPTESVLVVQSNLGYQLRIDMGGGWGDNLAGDPPFCVWRPMPYLTNPAWGCVKSITLIDTTVDPCDPLQVCHYSRVWPTLHITYPNSHTIVITDQMGRSTTYTSTKYPKGRLNISPEFITTVQESGGRTRTIQYVPNLLNGGDGGNENTRGRVAAVVEGQRSWTYERTSSGFESLAPGTILKYAISRKDSDNRTVTFRSAVRIVPGYAYTEPYLREIEDADGNITSWSWYGHVKLRPRRITQPSGAFVEYTYDHRQNITSIVSSPAGGGAPVRTQWGYDTTCGNYLTCNKPNFRIDESNRRTDYTYDPVHGGILSALEPASAVGGQGNIRGMTSYEYDDGGVGIFRLVRTRRCTTAQACPNSADEVVTETLYDTQRRPVRNATRSGDWAQTTATAEDPRSSVSNITYTVMGDVASLDGPLPGPEDTAYNYYNDARQIVAKVSPDPDGAGPLARTVERYSYDAGGKQIRIDIGTANTIDASDFNLIRFKRMTYEAASGLLIKTEEVFP